MIILGFTTEATEFSDLCKQNGDIFSYNSNYHKNNRKHKT